MTKPSWTWQRQWTDSRRLSSGSCSSRSSPRSLRRGTPWDQEAQTWCCPRVSVTLEVSLGAWPSRTMRRKSHPISSLARAWQVGCSLMTSCWRHHSRQRNSWYSHLSPRPSSHRWTSWIRWRCITWRLWLMRELLLSTWGPSSSRIMSPCTCYRLSRVALS